MILLKKDTAVTIPFGPFLKTSDGFTAETALTIATADVRLSKNGGANAAKNSTTATAHNELGYYNIHLSATDTNTLGMLKVMISKEGALPVWADFMVVTPMIYDVMCGAGNLTGIKLDPIQGAITWAQQKIIANVADEGAFHIENTNAYGIANMNIGGYAGQFNEGGIGQQNSGTSLGQGNEGLIGQKNESFNSVANARGQVNKAPAIGKNQEGFDPAINAGLALEATLTALKGTGWTNETLKAIYDAIGNGGGSGITAEDVWTYVNRTLTASPTDISELLKAADYTAPNNQGIADIKAKTDNLPAQPAAKGDVPTVEQIQAGLATEENATENKGTILEAIEEKPVTPEVDVSNLPTKDDLATAKDAIINAMPDIDISTIPDDVLQALVVGDLTVAEVLKVLAAIELGTVTGGGTSSFTYEGKDGTKVTLSGVDEDGNRANVNVEFE